LKTSSGRQRAVPQSHTEELKNVKEELADIFIFLTYLSEEYKIDLQKEVEKKIVVNEEKYPVEKAKGSAKKYTAL